MNVGVIVLLIILILAILTGIGVGLYFLLRKPTPASGGNGPPAPPGNPPGGVTPPGTNGPPTTPSGNTGTVPPNIVQGTFSMQSVAQPNLYITIGNNSDPNSRSNPSLIASSNNSISCTNYAWQNLYNYNIYPQQNGNVSSALISNITTLTEGGFTQTIPPFFTIVNEFGQSPSTLLSQTGVFPNGGNDYLVWNYNRTNRIWCGPSTGSFANTCLYLETDNTISSRTFNSSDNRFQWNNVPALTSPNCLPA